MTFPPALKDLAKFKPTLRVEDFSKGSFKAISFQDRSTPAPRYLLHDRDCVYGAAFHQRVSEMGIHEILTASRSPWQNAHAERFIGTLRRECLDHLIIFNEHSLKRILKSYFEYYEHSRTHLSLGKDPPVSRAVQASDSGRVVELPQVGELHHRYERRAA